MQKLEYVKENQDGLRLINEKEKENCKLNRPNIGFIEYVQKANAFF